MSTSDKNIKVCFASYKPYEIVPCFLITLGSISRADFDTLMSEIEKHTPAEHACINSLHAKYTESASLNRIPGKPYRRLELTDMFTFETGKLPCKKHMKATDKETQLMRVCAKNLAAGKCTDAFMRRTFGAALFPQFYGKDKQK